MEQLPLNNSIKLKVNFFRSGQVEEYQLGTGELEEFDCPDCNGTGEECFDFEGIDSFDICSNCGGSGVFYSTLDQLGLR
jgi:DnaJ-class molecular chaperone